MGKGKHHSNPFFPLTHIIDQLMVFSLTPYFVLVFYPALKQSRKVCGQGDLVPLSPVSR